MRIDLILIDLAFLHVTDIDWSSSGDFADLVYYDYATITVKGYPAEKIALVKRQMLITVQRCPLELLPSTWAGFWAWWVRWFTKLNMMTGGTVLILMIMHASRRMSQLALWLTSITVSGSRHVGRKMVAILSDEDRLIIAAASAWISKTATTSPSRLRDFIKGLVDEVETPHAATESAEKEIKW